MEYRLRRADGVYRWILDRGTPLFATGGVFQGYIGSCVDVTDVKAAQETHSRRERLESIGKLAAGIAHDFNNLLSGIVVETDLLGDELPANSAATNELQTIRTLALRGSEIVRQLMVYSGTERPDFEALQLSDVIREMLELLKVSVPKQVELTTQFEQKLPKIRGNASQIRQILMNLIINASEAIGEAQGTITVTASRVTGGKDLAPDSGGELEEGDYVRLEVSDTGRGMTAEEKTRIFEPFFTTKSQGRGLGLAVVFGAVRAHNGAIHIISEPRQGTKFQVFFPCNDAILKEVEAATGTIHTSL
jgi:signal transduction histidine kinase